MTVNHQVISDTLGLTTDHFPIVIELPPSNLQQKSRTIQYRKLKNVDIDAFKNDLQESYKAIDENANFETLSAQYHDLSSSVVNEHSPLVTRTCANAYPPWIDQEFKESRALRRKFEKVWKKDRTDINRTNYIEQKKRCADLI